MKQSALFQTVLDSLDPAIIMVDAESIIVTVNQAAVDIIKVTKEEAIGKHYGAFFDTSWPLLKTVFETATPLQTRETELGDSTVLADFRPIIFENSIRGVVVVFRSIPEPEATQTGLKCHIHLAKQLDAIFESTYDGLYVADGQANSLRVNSAFERITGLRATEVIGRNMRDLEKEGYTNKSVTLEVLRQRKRVTFTSTLKTGKEVLVTASPIFNDNKGISLVVCNVRDLTDLNRLHRQLEATRKLNEEYRSKLGIDTKNYPVIAVSEDLKSVMDLASRVANADVPILLQGETGVGKGVVAQYIHQVGTRTGRFMTINCGAIPETLLESELFGYKKGAFSGANQSGKEGLFQLADNGTLFLDEIDSLSISLQSKLLLAVQDLMILPLGGTIPRKINTRIIAASNRDLSRLVSQGSFRKDLFFRLNVVPIHIPPLRERKDDVLPLANAFLTRYNRKYTEHKYLVPDVMEALECHDWPGNVRELCNLIERLVVTTLDDEITIEDLPANMRARASSPGLCAPAEMTSLKEAVSQFEARYISDAVQKFGSARKAARVLEVQPSTLTRKIKRYSTGE